MPVTVREITMVAPDIIRVVVRDQEIEKGNLVALGAPDAGAANTTVQRTNPRSGLTEYALVTGLNKMYLRFYDTVPTVYMDRAAADNVSNYPTIGGRTVTDVYRISKPFDQGIASNGSNVLCVAMEHELFLKLNGNLPEGGPYSISNSGTAFPTTAFTFDDKVSRCHAIHATQAGHRPTDGDKVAYLSSWIPGYGTEGRVDFASTYSITEFNIIDNHGTVVFTGDVELQIGPTTAEDAANLIWYPSTTVAPKVITGITKANPGVVTIAGHGFSSGQHKILRGIGGMTELEGALVTITVVNANSFSIGINTSGYGTYVAGTYLSGYDSLCYNAFQANRAATYVYRMDYSAFAPAQASQYRVQIDGMGCSYPFEINPAVHYQTAHKHMQGYYNQCFGIALDADVGGWDRPVNYRDGVNGCLIYESTLPASMENEVGLFSPSLSDQGGTATWITSNRVTDWFGGWSDAGDWDAHWLRHAPALWLMLDLAYERLPTLARSTDFGFPRASDTFGSYTSMYDSIDALPDVIHMVLHYAEPFRRFQKANGRIYGGYNFYEAGTGEAGGGNVFGPSWISAKQMFLLEGDHASAMAYAGVAAKLGKLLKAAGFNTLGQTWIDSAVAAWDWGYAIFTGYASGGIANATWRAHYITALDIKTKSGWTDLQLTTHFDSVNLIINQHFQFFAAGNLWSATQNAAYATIMKQGGLGARNATGISGFGVWEYSMGPVDGDASHQDYYKGPAGIPATAANYYTEHFSGSTSYRYSGDSYFTAPSPEPMWLIWRQIILDEGEDGENLKLLHAGENFWSGANQEGICCTIGLGSYNPPNSLHRDREASATPTQGVPGLTLYTWFYNNGGATPGGTGGILIYNFATDSPLNFTVNTPVGDQEATYGTKRIVTPYYLSVPAMQAHWANTFCIFQTEFVTQDQIIGRFVAAMWRHGWDGNTDTDMGGPVTVSCITH